MFHGHCSEICPATATVERRTEVVRAAGLTDWDSDRGDLPEIHDE